jgi:alkylresorcinol/alkylpyrone synthase
MVTSAAVVGLGVAHPPKVRQAELWQRFFAGHYAGVAQGFAQRVFENSGVTTRHGVINPIVEDPSGWPTGARMQRYLAEALPLGKDAASSALAQAGVLGSDVGLLVVCSCTGYVTPGLDILLARDLGLPADSRRVFIGHMGCYASMPGLAVATDYVRLHQRPAVLLCVELPSLHVQPPTRDPQQIVAHALFSDAAAAAVLVPGPEAVLVAGPEAVLVASPAGQLVGGSDSVTDTRSAEYMTWHVTDLGFRIGLSPQVPEVLARYVAPLVTRLVSGAGLEMSAVDGWAVHPGGPRILDVVQRELLLADQAMADSRAVLAEHGNCSSPTVLMILDRLRQRTAPVGPVVLTAFGPGLTLYASLLVPMSTPPADPPVRP